MTRGSVGLASEPGSGPWTAVGGSVGYIHLDPAHAHRGVVHSMGNAYSTRTLSHGSQVNTQQRGSWPNEQIQHVKRPKSQSTMTWGKDITPSRIGKEIDMDRAVVTPIVQ